MLYQLMALASFIVFGAAFIMHELMHKFVAQSYGYEAQFRMFPFFLILAMCTTTQQIESINSR